MEGPQYLMHITIEKMKITMIVRKVRVNYFNSELMQRGTLVLNEDTEHLQEFI